MCGCNTTPCVQTISCSPCTYTLNTDCIFYTGDRLSFESASIVDGSSRSVSDIIEKISATRQKFPSKILAFDTDTPSYTLDETDLGKTLLLSGSDDGVIGTVTFTLNIPSTVTFMDEEIVIKNISTPLNPGSTNYEWTLNVAINTGYDPVATSTSFTTLSTNGVLRLRFVQDQFGTYKWMRV